MLAPIYTMRIRVFPSTREFAAQANNEPFANNMLDQKDKRVFANGAALHVTVTQLCLGSIHALTIQEYMQYPQISAGPHDR